MKFLSKEKRFGGRMGLEFTANETFVGTCAHVRD